MVTPERIEDAREFGQLLVTTDEQRPAGVEDIVSLAEIDDVSASIRVEHAADRHIETGTAEQAAEHQQVVDEPRHRLVGF